MVYSKQTWLDRNSSYPLSASRLNHIETGIESASSSFFNVKDHGVVGDGTTDDAPAINALITAITNNTLINAPLYFPAGTYAIGAPIDLPRYSDKMKQIRLFGVGRNATVLKGIGSGAPFDAIIRHQLPRDSVSNAVVSSAGAAHEISHLRIDSQKKSKFNILLTNAHAVHVHNFYGLNPALQVDAGEETANIKIEGTGSLSEYLSWEHHIGPNIRIEGGGGSDPAQWSTYNLWIDSTDNHADGVVAVRAAVANVHNSSSNNFYTNVHTFFGDIAFWDNCVSKAGSTYVNCEADGPGLIGWKVQSQKVSIVGNRVFWPGSAPVGAVGIKLEINQINTVIVGNTFWDSTDTFLPANAITNTVKLGEGCVVGYNANSSFNNSPWELAGSMLVKGNNPNAASAANALGSGSADLQFTRSGASEVASGALAFAAGGRNTATGRGTLVVGEQNFANTDFSVSTGNRATANGARGQRSHAAGRFAANGDQQYSDMPVSASTSSTTLTKLRSNASGTNSGNLPLLLTAIPSAALVTVRMVGLCPSTADAISWEMKGMVAKDTAVSTTAIIGTPTWTVVAGTTTGLTTATPTFTVDNTTGSYSINVTAPNSNTWHWNARIDTVMVG